MDFNENIQLSFRKELTEGNSGECLEALLLHFSKGGRLNLADAVHLSEVCRAKLRAEDNLLRLSGTITVVGDIHGQFYDLVKIIKLNGTPPSTKYLFLGNVIGGGGFNCETLLFLLAAKAKFPDHVFLLRGPNESLSVSSAFNLESECSLKYSKQLYGLILQVFETLPLAAVVKDSFFCVHGGLSPDIEYIESICSLHRFRDVPVKGAMCDLLWADPHWDAENPVSVERSPSDEYYTPETNYYNMKPDFSPNMKRGRSYVFNFASIKYFLTKNKILCIVRSHEVEDNGYKLYRALPSTNYPCMISVFSAPNYCDSFANMGAVVTIGNEVKIQKFFCSPYPFFLTNSNTFLWSASFIVRSVVDIFDKLLGGE